MYLKIKIKKTLKLVEPNFVIKILQCNKFCLIMYFLENLLRLEIYNYYIIMNILLMRENVPNQICF